MSGDEKSRAVSAQHLSEYGPQVHRKDEAEQTLRKDSPAENVRKPKLGIQNYYCATFAVFFTFGTR